MAKSTGASLKEKKVKELVEKIKKARSLMVVSIKGLPSKQFQDIKKSIREHAFIKVEKKNILTRAVKELKKDSALPLESHISDSCAFAISDIEGYELAGILAKKKTPVFARAGQIAPTDIEVKEGPTDLVPGPAISELGALGIQISVENGKIAIKKDKIIVKEGSVIHEGAAAVLQKLGVQPFSVGLNPVALYDVKEEKIYTDLKIDSDAVIANLKNSAARSLGFAQKIVYVCKETIGYFLAKANMEAKAIETKTQLNSQGGTA
ncbi:50S ribosomal protein L10 [Candidatus Pacearchaeota archaeon]|nr:50S ribosomal protein L10 [Candidatus Pacearchaeota archaeon]